MSGKLAVSKESSLQTDNDSLVMAWVRSSSQDGDLAFFNHKRPFFLELLNFFNVGSEACESASFIGFKLVAVDQLCG